MPARDTKKDLFFFLVFLILFLFTFHEFFFGRRVFFERDTTTVEIPVRKLTVSLLKEGRFGLWTDAYGNGQPFLANPKNAVFYPATLLYLVLPLFAAFRLYYLVHVILGWLGLYYLCRSHSLSEKAAFIGASLFAFSGMYLSSFEFYNHIAALAWMPWILLLIDREPRPGRSRFVPLAILWTLLVLAGSPEMIVITVFLAAAHSFLKPGAWRRRLAAAALPFALAFLLSAAQLFPAFEMLHHAGARGSQSGIWPLELVQLSGLAFPGLLGNDRQPGHDDYWGGHLFSTGYPLYYSLYMGFGALLLFLFALRRPWDRRRRVLVPACGFFFLLACGRYSPFFFLYRLTPLLHSIRYPVKFFIGSVFCLAVLAALGFDEAVKAEGVGTRTFRAVAAAAAAALVLFLLLRDRLLSFINRLMIINKASSLVEIGRSIGTGLAVLAVFAAGLAFLAAVKARGRSLTWALLFLAVLDPVYHNRWINPTVPESFFDRPAIVSGLGAPLTVYRIEGDLRSRQDKSGSEARFLAYCRGTLNPLSGLGDGVRYVLNSDFYGTYPSRYLDLVKKVQGLPPESQLKVLRFVGCMYCIGESPAFSLPGALRLEVEGLPVSVEKIAARPAAPYVVHAVAHAADLEDEIRLFTDIGFDPWETALVRNDTAGPGLSESIAPAPTAPGAIVVEKEVQGSGRYTADLPANGIAIFPGNCAPGWQAWIDGRKAGVFGVNLFAKGVRVPAGRHTVVLKYLPGSFIAGTATTLAALVFLAAVVFAAARRLRRRARPSSL